MELSVILIVVSIALTVYLIKKNLNIGLIMLIDCIFIIWGTKMQLPAVLNTITLGLFGSKTINLILLLTTIMIIENIMRKSNMIRQMSENLKLLVKNSFLSSAIMPIVLGLLPSPGGARFSCPMVEEICGEKLSNVNKAFLNYWFRHIWMDGFILYPGIIIISELTGIPLLNVFLHMLPLMFFAFLSGTIIIAWKIKTNEIISPENKIPALKAFIGGFSPIFILISLYMSLIKITAYSLIISTMVTIIYLLIFNKYSWKQFLETLKESINFKYIILIAGVMIFNQFLNNSGLTDHFVKTIAYYNIPREAIFVLLPLCAALLSGITVSYVSLTFPLLIPLGVANNVWFTTLAFTAGFIGNMITPLHLCATMSCDYFKVNVGKLLIKVLIALIIMSILSSIFFFIVLH